MEVRELINARKDIGLLKIVMPFVILVSMGVAVYSNYLANQEIKEAYQRIWVLDETNQAYSATALVVTDPVIRNAKYQNTIEQFYYYWFNLDQFNYKNNIERGLNLLGNSGKEMLADYKSENLERTLQEKNYRFTIMIDSIRIDDTQDPVVGYAFGRQKLIRERGQAMRFMWSKFTIEEVGISNLNPHGVLLDNFVIINNDPIN
jgi:hypothetical protein